MLDRFLDELEKLATQYYGLHGEWSYTFSVEDDGVEIRLFIPYFETALKWAAWRAELKEGEKSDA